jgi:hypothetical protein
VFEKSLEDCDGGTDSPAWSCQDESWAGSRKKGEVVFIGSSNEKGTFFEGEIELTAPFDIEKLELYYDEVDGEELSTVCITTVKRLKTMVVAPTVRVRTWTWYA